MKTKTSNTSLRQSGFSLVEIMVGMAIGMLGIIVMMQVYSASEERRRTTTGGSDAQNSAVIALDGLQRDISHSGHGFTSTRLLNCNVQLPFGNPVPLAPVIINPPTAVIPAGDANTDTLLVSYGTANDQPEGYSVLNQAGTTYTIVGTGLMRQNDRVIAAPAACGATLVLGSVQAANASVIQLTSSEAGTALFNLGAAPRFLAYAIRSGNLTVCDYMTSNCSDSTAATLANENIWRPIAGNVVSMRAQYGHDNSGTMDGIVDIYNQTTPTTNCGWARASAVRLALVARSTQFEKEVVTGVAPTWANGAGTTIDLSKNPDGSDNALWGNYRYRVYETLVPIRNVAWMGVPAGC